MQRVVKFSLLARVWHFPAANIKHVRISPWQKLENNLGEASQNCKDKVNKKAPEIVISPGWVFLNKNVDVLDYWDGWHLENELYACIASPFLNLHKCQAQSRANPNKLWHFKVILWLNYKWILIKLSAINILACCDLYWAVIIITLSYSLELTILTV